jgi:small subunit ribosomal protein S9
MATEPQVGDAEREAALETGAERAEPVGGPEGDAVPAQTADAPSATAAPTPEAAPIVEVRAPRTGQFHAIGRRKTAVARVFLRPGTGRWRINGRTFEDYFPRAVLRQSAARPLTLTQYEGQFDVLVNVDGGGLRGQAEAVRLAVARALLEVDEDLRRVLRSEELLTRDAREVERKKPGRPGARKRFQFSKR